MAGALEKQGRFLKQVPCGGLHSKHVCVSPAALGASFLGESASRLQEELGKVSCGEQIGKSGLHHEKGWRREKQSILEG